MRKEFGVCIIGLVLHLTALLTLAEHEWQWSPETVGTDGEVIPGYCYYIDPDTGNVVTFTAEGAEESCEESDRCENFIEYVGEAGVHMTVDKLFDCLDEAPEVSSAFTFTLVGGISSKCSAKKMAACCCEFDMPNAEDPMILESVVWTLDGNIVDVEGIQREYILLTRDAGRHTVSVLATFVADPDGACAGCTTEKIIGFAQEVDVVDLILPSAPFKACLGSTATESIGASVVNLPDYTITYAGQTVDGDDFNPGNIAGAHDIAVEVSNPDGVAIECASATIESHVIHPKIETGNHPSDPDISIVCKNCEGCPSDQEWSLRVDAASYWGPDESSSGNGDGTSNIRWTVPDGLVVVGDTDGAVELKIRPGQSDPNDYVVEVYSTFLPECKDTHTITIIESKLVKPVNTPSAGIVDNSGASPPNDMPTIGVGTPIQLQAAAEPNVTPSATTWHIKNSTSGSQIDPVVLDPSDPPLLYTPTEPGKYEVYAVHSFASRTSPINCQTGTHKFRVHKVDIIPPDVNLCLGKSSSMLTGTRALALAAQSTVNRVDGDVLWTIRQTTTGPTPASIMGIPSEGIRGDTAPTLDTTLSPPGFYILRAESTLNSSIYEEITVRSQSIEILNPAAGSVHFEHVPLNFELQAVPAAPGTYRWDHRGAGTTDLFSPFGTSPAAAINPHTPTASGEFEVKATVEWTGGLGSGGSGSTSYPCSCDTTIQVTIVPPVLDVSVAGLHPDDEIDPGALVKLNIDRDTEAVWASTDPGFAAAGVLEGEPKWGLQWADPGEDDMLAVEVKYVGTPLPDPADRPAVQLTFGHSSIKVFDGPSKGTRYTSGDTLPTAPAPGGGGPWTVFVEGVKAAGGAANLKAKAIGPLSAHAVEDDINITCIHLRNDQGGTSKIINQYDTAITFKAMNATVASGFEYHWDVDGISGARTGAWELDDSYTLSVKYSNDPSSASNIQLLRGARNDTGNHRKGYPTYLEIKVPGSSSTHKLQCADFLRVALDEYRGTRLTAGSGSGYAAAPTVSFAGGGGTGAAGEVQINPWGEVTSVRITSGGSGYTSAPTISFTSTSGTGANGTVNLSGDSVSSVVIDVVATRNTEVQSLLPPGGLAAAAGSGASSMTPAHEAQLRGQQGCTR